MRIAFYAPLKAPTHAVPSGDRTIARGLIAALEYAGYRVQLASDLRLYDGTGDALLQARLEDTAKAETLRLISDPDARNWRGWLTYHNYYKAPDLIGPRVSAALDIPYLQIESTRARKRLTGPWARFARSAEAASDAAHAIFYFTHHDAETLRRDAPEGQNLVHLSPFLARPDLPPASTLDGPMLSVGMMRPGDKIASYRIIAETLERLPAHLNWHLNIAGSGVAKSDVAKLMAPFGAHVTLLGKLGPDALARLFKTASLMFWPGVNEAFGMAYLEAQAAGIPVVAQDRPGVREVVAGPQCRPDADTAALADYLEAMLVNTAARAAAGETAREKMAAKHLLGSAAGTLDHVIKGII